MLLLVENLHDKLISIWGEEGRPGFAVDIQVVNVVRSLEADKMQINVVMRLEEFLVG